MATERGSKLWVCKITFHSTLGMKTDATLTEFIKTKRKSYKMAINPCSDGKGRYRRDHKLDKQIRAHINGYQPHVSNCKCKNAPSCQYLDIKELQENFVKNVTACCYSEYREIIASENIGFTPPSDECDLCLAFKLHSDTANH